MLQDVQELRDHMWVPRERQDQQLKTIDQVYIYGEGEGLVGGEGNIWVPRYNYGY